jgi:hypothetical protein
MRLDAAFCIGGKRIGDAWTPNENSDTLQARIKANTLDIGKLPTFFRLPRVLTPQESPRLLVVTAYNPKQTVKKGADVLQSSITISRHPLICFERRDSAASMCWKQEWPLSAQLPIGARVIRRYDIVIGGDVGVDRLVTDLEDAPDAAASARPLWVISGHQGTS